MSEPSVDLEPKNTVNTTSEGLRDLAIGMGIGIKDLSEEEIWQKIVEFRKEQHAASRLCEHLTGIRPADERLIERIEKDHKIIRQKYGLPARKMREAFPGRFRDELLAIAKKLGVRVKPRSEAGGYFSRGNLAGAVYFETKHGGGDIAVDLRGGSEREFSMSLWRLEHEVIHALQDLRYPSMPVEVMEWEAYVGGWNTKKIREKLRDDKFFLQGLMGVYVLGSVLDYYKEHGGEPVWNKAEYFLKQDAKKCGLSEEDGKLKVAVSPIRQNHA